MNGDAAATQINAGTEDIAMTAASTLRYLRAAAAARLQEGDLYVHDRSTARREDD
jgi:hypothetical protein